MKNCCTSLTRLITGILCIAMLLSCFVFPIEATENLSGDATEEEVTIVSEDTLLRDMYTKHYMCSDGKYVAVMYPEAVHYLDDNGEWKDVDNRLIRNSVTGNYETANNPSFSLAFSTVNKNLMTTAKEQANLRLAQNNPVQEALTYGILAYSGGKELPVSMSASASASTASMTASIDKISAVVSAKEDVGAPIGKKVSDPDAFALPNVSDKIVYPGFFGNGMADVEYIISQNKVKENIILHEDNVIDSFVYTVPANGMTAVVEEDGSVLLQNSDGETQYTIGIPYLYDAADSDCYDVKVTAEEKDGTIYITYAIDTEWLFSEERAHPIIFDPTIMMNNFVTNIIDTYVVKNETEEEANSHLTDKRLRVGNLNGNEQISLMRIPFPNSMPKSAVFTKIEINLRILSGTTTGSTFGVYAAYNGNWPSPLTHSDIMTMTNGGNSPITSQAFVAGKTWYSFDVTSNAVSMYRGGNPDVCYAIKYTDSSVQDHNSFYSSEATIEEYRPYITMTYSATTEIYRISHVGTGKYLTLYNGRSTDSNICIASKATSNSDPNYYGQFFRMVTKETNGVFLYPLCKLNGYGGALSIEYSSDLNNANVCSNNGNGATYFSVKSLGNSANKLVLQFNPTYALTANDGPSGGTSNTSPQAQGNAYMKYCNGDGSSYFHWVLEKADPWNEVAYEPYTFWNPFGKDYTNNIRVSSNYGRRGSNLDFHAGLDIAVPKGTPLYPPFLGTVDAVGYDPYRGYYIVIKAMHLTVDRDLSESAERIRVVYQHMNSPSPLSVGDTTPFSKIVGYSGNTGTSTGPHLHIEILKERIDGGTDKRLRTIDPMVFYAHLGNRIYLDY